MIDRLIVFGDSDNLIINFPLIFHSHNPDNLSIDKCHDLNLNTADNKNVQRIMIIPIGHRNKPIIGRIMHSTEQHSIQFNQPTFFVQLVLGFATGWDFDQCTHHFWGGLARGHEVPGVLCHQIPIVLFWGVSGCFAHGYYNINKLNLLAFEMA